MAKIDLELGTIIKEKYPHLLKKPKGEILKGSEAVEKRFNRE
jgi:hypothetical protein